MNFINQQFSPLLPAITLEESYNNILELNAYPKYIKAYQENINAQGTVAYENAINNAQNYLNSFIPEPLVIEIPSTRLNDECFSGWIRDFANYLSLKFHMSFGEVMHVMLPMAGVGSFGHYQVCVDANWVENVCGYHILVKEHGLMSSELLNFIASPIYGYEKELINNDSSKEKQDIHGELTKILDLNKKEVYRDLARLVKDGKITPDEVQRELLDRKRTEEQFLSPTPSMMHAPKLSLGIWTRASLIRHLVDHGGHGNVIGYGIPLMCNKINDNMSFLLSLCSHNRIDYNGQGGKQMAVHSPSLMILNTLHPDEMIGLYKMKKLQNVGFLDRLVVCHGINTHNANLQRISDEDGENLMKHFQNTIRALAKQHYSQSLRKNFKVLTVTPEAYQVLKKYKMSYSNYSAVAPAAAGYISKSYGLAVRIAAYIHLLNNPESPGQISESEMLAGIEMAQMLTPHAYYFFNHQEHEINANAKKIIEHIQNRCSINNTRFFVSYITGNMNDMNKDKAMPALRRLQKKKYLIVFHGKDNKTECIVNQRVFDQNFSLTG